MAIYVFEPELLTHTEVCYCVVRSCSCVCGQHSTYCISHFLDLGVSKLRVVVTDSIFFFTKLLLNVMENSWLHMRISRGRARACVRACLQFSFTQTLSSDVTHSQVHAILYTRYSEHLCRRSRLSSAGMVTAPSAVTVTAAWLWNRGSTHTRARDLYIL